MEIAKKIEPYSIMVKWNDEKIKDKNKIVGSGVLVKTKDNECYLFTARHLFKKGEDKYYKGVRKSFVNKQLNKISIYKQNLKNEIFVDELLYFNDDLDLLVFSLKESPIEHLPIISILKNEHQIQNYHFYGYPIGAKNSDDEYTGHLERGKYIQSNQEEKDVFRLRSKNNLSGDDVAGYSGSGIFVESEEKIEVTDDEKNKETITSSIIYLVGILIRAKEGLSYYEGIDLSNIIEDINKEAKINIPIIENAIELNFTKHIKTRILKRNRDDMFVQQINNLDNDLLLDFLNSNDSTLTQMTKKLADFYLLGGMIYRDKGEEISAKKYFRLATKFNPRYKKYEKSYKGNQNNTIEEQWEEIENEQEEEVINHYHVGIIEFNYKRYSNAKENFIKHLKKEDINILEKIESYKYLSKIFLNEKNYIESETYAIQALDEYDENHFLEKVELYYKLFEICNESEGKCSSSGWVEKGLKYIRSKKREEHQDEKVLVIHRKLERKEKELKKDNKMTTTLMELVELYPEEYIKEFLNEYKNSKSNEQKNYITIHSKVKELEGYLNEIKDEKVKDEESTDNPPIQSLKES